MNEFIYILVSILRKAIGFYTFLIFIRVVTSWFPNLNKYKAIQVVAKLVDPYLNLFKRFIPPIGGVMDISPIVAFFSLQFLEWLIVTVLL